jgi:MtrB/PioB family decaheme-associated outer membrane protein
MNIQHKLLSKAIRESIFRGTLWASVFAAALASGSLYAQEAVESEDEVDESDLLIEEQTVVKSEIEVGIGNVSDSSYRFGRYNGLEDSGLFPIVNLDIYKRGPWDGDDASYWRLTGNNLGIETRDLTFEMGRQGSYNFYIGFDEIPNYQYDDSFTIFNGAGSNNLTLPAGWVPGQTTATMAQLVPNLRPYDIEHSRKRFDIGGDVNFMSGWNFEVNFNREQKDGNKTIGLTMGNSGGNPRAILAPEPVDYQTDTIEAVLTYADTTKQLSVGYYVSLFDNDNNSLVWQNPYSSINGWTPTAQVGYPNGQGQMHLEPDNEFHQFNVSGGWNFSPTTRLSGDVSFGRATQDQDFLPYTINPLLAATVTQPLPVNSLDGEVETTFIALRFTTQPFDNLSLGANYKFDDRDNTTHHHEFVYVAGDSLAQNTAVTSGQRRFNEPKSYRDQSFKLDANWNAVDWLRVNGEAQFRQTERPHQEREEIDEERYALNFAVDTGGYINGGLRMSSSDRDGGSDYQGWVTLIGGYSPGYYNTLQPFVDGFPFENHPDLRKFNQADRERLDGELYASFMPVEEVAVSASVSYAEDDYDNSILGLTFSRVSSYNIDVAWAPTSTTSAYIFASEERYKNDQDGRSFVGGATRPVSAFDPNRVWNTKSRDYVFTYGAGVNTKFLEDKLTVGIDYVNSAADSDILTTTGSALTRRDLPTSTSDLSSASVYGDYRWRRDITFRLRFAMEDFESTDWAVDDVPANQLANVILLGEGSPDYRVWVTSFSVGYRF